MTKKYTITYETYKVEDKHLENPPCWFEESITVEAESEQAAIDEVLTASPYCILDYWVEETA